MDEVKVLKSPEYLRVLQEEKLITFATFVNGHEAHHQISILEYDTREKIEQKMAETLVQVSEEMKNSNNEKRSEPVPQDIQSLVDDSPIQ